VKSLFEEDITAQTDKDIGMVTTAIGFSLSFFLALYKYEIGHKLQSLTITAGNQVDYNKTQSCILVPTVFLLILTPLFLNLKDATSSLCSGLTSLSALVVTILDPYFWWADSGTGGLVALYTLYKGISTMIHSMVNKIEYVL
jgi:divalent metal cation (Fe/Co/Zn/Cd) transporter